MRPHRFYWLPAVVLIGLSSSAFATDEAAGAAEEKTPEELQAEVREILNRDPEVEDYIDATRCLPTRKIDSIEVLDEKHVTFKISRSEYYLVQMEHRCPGMRRGQPVMYETRSAQVCKHDSIRALERWGLGLQPGMRCAIPGFKSVTKEQIVALKEILKAERRNKRKG